MFSEWLDEERIWIHLYHHLLLAATRQDNSVFTWLNKTTLEENFNAYFDQYSVDPRRRSADELVQMRETFVPGVIEALRQSQRIAIANSRRTEVSQFDISPEMIKTYASIAPGDGPALADFPSNTFTELWSFLDDTVQQQRPLLSQMGSMAFVISNIDSEEYSNETLSVSSQDEIHEGDKVDAEFNLRELHKNETIVKDEGGRIKATFTMKIIGESQDSEQVNELPSKTSGSSDATKESCVQPEIRRHLVQPPVFGQVWTRKSPQEFVWTRGHDEWEPAACFRVFRKDNNAYLKLIHRSHLFTQSINPNDKSWKVPYNKALHSIARTYDSDRIVNSKVPWTDLERKALYRSINRWCKLNGVHQFPPENIQKFYEQAAQDINMECHAEEDEVTHRSIDAVASQLKNGLNGSTKANRPIAMLAERIIKMKERMKNGERLTDNEMYPEHAISMS